jgi:hypothetical protein
MIAGGTVHRILRVLRAVFAPAAVLFLLFAVYSARGIVEETLRHARMLPFLAAVLAWAISHLLAPALAWTVLEADGVRIGYARALRIHVSRLPARYLPGGIWHTVSRVADYSTLGATRVQLTRLVLLENSLPVALAAILGGGGMLLLGLAKPVAGAAVSLGALLLLALPFVLRHRMLSAGARFPVAAYLRAIIAMLGFWSVAAFAFCAYWSAFPQPEQAPALAAVASAYLLSWAAGFAMVFAPQGLGVFEGSIAALLQGATPFVDVVVLAAGFRAAVLGADLLAYAVYLALSRLRGPASPDSVTDPSDAR